MERRAKELKQHNRSLGQDQEPAEFPGVTVGTHDKAEDMEEDNTEWEHATLVAANANLELERPQIAFGRRQMTNEEETII